jgi:hypothetical protein
LNSLQEKYLNELIKPQNDNTENLKNIILKLKNLDTKAVEHCTALMYDYQCPVDVAILAFDITCKQIQAGKKANPQRIFQSLSKNNRSVYSAVKPCYDEAIQSLTKNSNKEKLTNNEDVSFAKQFLYENYFKAKETDRYVVNTCIIPKNAWLLNVYAISYSDYCEIVQNTVKEFNDAGITVFLTKPEEFQKDNISKDNPKLAYSILINEKFKFSYLSESCILLFDSGEDILKVEGIKIAKRVSVNFVSFVDSLFVGNNEEVEVSNKKYIESFENEEALLSHIEQIGTTDNIINSYIENYTGICQEEDSTMYKTVLCKTTDIIKIASILKNLETGKLDFLIDSNKDDIKILFVHLSHFSDFMKDIKNKNITIDLYSRLH